MDQENHANDASMNDSVAPMSDSELRLWFGVDSSTIQNSVRILLQLFVFSVF